jgi:RNA polymerase sigma-70 factor (ECF subfamily)
MEGHAGEAKSHLLATWWERHGDDLLAFARRRLVNVDDADDAVQDAMISAIESIAKGEVPRDERAVLFTFVRRRVVDRVRRDASRRRVLDEYRDILRSSGATVREQVYAIARDRVSGEPGDHLEKEEFWSRFRACLDTMPPLMRQAIVFREVDAMETKEVCELLGITKANLWTLVHRGRLRLRKELSPVLTGRSSEEQPS